MRVAELKTIEFNGEVWKLLNVRSNSQTYQNGSRVLKMYKDPQYSEWVRQIMKLQGNPMVPVVHDTGTHEDHEWVIMERLKPFAKKVGQEWIGWMIVCVKHKELPQSAIRQMDPETLNHFYKVADAARESVEHGYQLDTHIAGNVMSRNGYPVFTDLLG